MLLLAVAGAFVHFGTAMLRLGTFLPYPHQLDFASFYVGARALAAGAFPYPLSPEPPYRFPAEWLDRFLPGVPLAPEVPASTPGWLLLLAPFARLPFPAAAWLWLALQVVLVAACFRRLAGLAGLRGRASRWIGFVVVLTFGPVFLTLTLGQSSLVVLAAALWIGHGLARRASLVSAGPVWLAATAAKLTAGIWVAALLLLRRRAGCVTGTVVVATVVGLGAALPRGSEGCYWLDVVPTQARFYAEPPRGDDQSLAAWIDRVGREREFWLTGLSTAEVTIIRSRPPWEIDRRVLRAVGYGSAAALALVTILILWRSRSPAEQEAAFYLFVLLVLLAAPHTERYNHVLLLPAMAWLFPRGAGATAAVVGAYFLTAVSRLTHLWLLVLPAPWGALLSGAGVLAVVVLASAIVAVPRPRDGEPVA